MSNNEKMEEMIEKIQREVDEQNLKEEATRKKRAKRVEPDLAFDRNNLFTVDFSHMENALKFVLNEIDKLNTNVDKMQKDIKSRTYIVDKMHKEGNARDEAVKEHTKKLTDLERKSIDIENKQFEFNTNFESFRMNAQIQARIVSGMKETLNEIEEEREQQQEGSKPAPTPAASSSPISADNDIAKLSERIDGNDSLINGLIAKVKKLTDKMRDTSSTSDFDAKIKQIEREIEDMKSYNVPANTVGSNDGTTSSLNYNIKKKVDGVTKDCEELKNVVFSYQTLINSKADYDQLQEIDKVVTDKLNNCIKVVKRQVQDKSDSSKNLKKLEKQLRSIYDVLYNQLGASIDEDDPLFKRRAPSTWHCASCEKKMTLKDHKHSPWRKTHGTKIMKPKSKSKYMKGKPMVVYNSGSEPER